MSKIEAIIVDGVVYDLVTSTAKLCDQCAFLDDCILDEDCFAFWDNKHFERREKK